MLSSDMDVRGEAALKFCGKLQEVYETKIACIEKESLINYSKLQISGRPQVFIMGNKHQEVLEKVAGLNDCSADDAVKHEIMVDFVILENINTVEDADLILVSFDAENPAIDSHLLTKLNSISKSVHKDRVKLIFMGAENVVFKRLKENIGGLMWLLRDILRSSDPPVCYCISASESVRSESSGLCDSEEKDLREGKHT